MTTDAYMTLRLIGLLYGPSMCSTRDNPPTTINNLQLIPQAKRQLHDQTASHLASHDDILLLWRRQKQVKGLSFPMIYRNFDVCNVENFWEKWGHDLKFHIGKNSCANCSFARLLVPFMHQKSYVFACFTLLQQTKEIGSKYLRLRGTLTRVGNW